LAGQGLHTRHSEAFFPETTYHQEAFDVDGNLEHSKFPSYVDNETKGPSAGTQKLTYLSNTIAQ